MPIAMQPQTAGYFLHGHTTPAAASMRLRSSGSRPALHPRTFMSARASGVSPLLLCASTAAPSETARRMESLCPASAARCRAAGGEEVGSARRASQWSVCTNGIGG